MKKLLPLTEQQKNIWNTEMFYSGTAINNIGGYVFIEEKIDFELLNKALNLYVKSTDTCRFNFISKNSQVFQYVSDYSPINFDIIDVKSKDEVDKKSIELLNKPFDILNSNLFKFSIFRFPNGKGGFFVIFHHLISDAWTMSLLINRIMGIYSALLKSESPIQDFPLYSEYALESSKYTDSKKFNKDKEYWESVFEKEPNITYIYKDKSISPIDNISGAREICNIDKKLSQK